MLHILRVIWVLATLVNLFAVMWFVFGATANFQRGIDLVSTVILTYFGLPSILLIISSFILLFKGWPHSSAWGIVMVSIMILCMLSLSPTLFKSVNTGGWLSDNIVTDTLQTTADGQYEYQLELINLFQRNSHASLYIKNNTTGEEIRIPLDMPINTIKGLTMEKENYWIVLESTSDTDKYILYTTPRFPLSDETYEVNMKVRKAEKME